MKALINILLRTLITAWDNYTALFRFDYHDIAQVRIFSTAASVIERRVPGMGNVLSHAPLTAGVIYALRSIGKKKLSDHLAIYISWKRQSLNDQYFS